MMKRRQTILLCIVILGLLVALLIVYLGPFGGLPALVSGAERDQPWLKELFHWDNRIVAHAGDFFFAVKPGKGTAIPIHFVGNRTLVSLTTAMGKPYALGKAGHSYVLFSRTVKRDWDMVCVPSGEDGTADEYFAAVGSEKCLAVLGKNSFAVYDGTAWISRAYSKEFDPEYCDRYCIWGSSLYVGRDRGEFGGGLYAVDLSTGVWQEKDPFSGEPVTDVRVGPDGALWVVCGLAHLGGIHGRLARVTEQGVLDQLNLNNIKGKVTNTSWPHDPSSFAALQFDVHGEPVLLAEQLGIMVRCGDRWERLTPKWPEHVYLGSLLALGNGQYLIGTFDAGLFFVDTRDNTGKAIRFATSFYEWGGGDAVE